MKYWHWHVHDSLLIAHPVGDGNAIELQNCGTSLMDCGGDYTAVQALRSASARGMSEFLLTHLHADHYSGVVKQPTGTVISYDVKHVFLPALPLIESFELTRNFALALYTMNVILGGKTGVPEQDLIDNFTSLNPGRTMPSHTFLSKGDLFDLAGTPFQVLWPPRAVSGLVSQAAKRAINDFNKAIESNRRAKKIRDRLIGLAVQAAKHAERQFKRDEDSLVQYGDDVADEDDEDSSFNVEDNDNMQGVPDQLKSANRAIRGVANRLSLAFRCGSRLIHLGDLEKAELNQVVIGLGGATNFFGMIAAHHGTHFSSRMKDLYAQDLVVSNGKQRPNIKQGYREISHRIQETNIHGHSYLVF